MANVVMIRSVSASSTSTDSSHSTESVPSFNSSLGIYSPPASYCQANISSAFSALHQQYQAGRIENLAYEDQGHGANGWSARLIASIKGQAVSSEANGISKKEAKHSAAEALLLQYHSISREVQIIPYLNPIPTLRLVKANAAPQQLAYLETLFHESGIHASNKTIVAIDVECWERGRDVITEIGLAWIKSQEIFSGPGVLSKIASRHLIVEERVGLHNGTFVPDEKGNFKFGQSEYIGIDHLQAEIEAQMAEFNEVGEVVLVGHTIAQDIRWLKGIGVMMEYVKSCDIGAAYTYWHSRRNTVGLEAMLRELQISYQNLHNAGNDCVYTLQACLSMMTRVGTTAHDYLV